MVVQEKPSVKSSIYSLIRR